MRNNSGGADEVLDTYELFGGAKKMNDMRHLELIPIWMTKSVSERKVVSLSELSSNDAGNPAGGYAPASYQAKNNRLIVEMAPVGAAPPAIPPCATGSTSWTRMATNCSSTVAVPPSSKTGPLGQSPW